MRALSVPCIAAVALAMASGPACEKTTTEHRLDGPLRLAMGDCANTSTKYVSGHKPEPFDLKGLKKGKVGSPHKHYAGSRARHGGAGTGRSGGPDGAPEDGPTNGSPNGLTGTAPSRPRMSIGRGKVRGKLDASAIRTTIESKSERLLACYESALAEDSELAGTVSVAFTINRRGKVRKASAAGVTEEVARCVLATFRTMRFARPGRGKVTAQYAVKFSPGAQRSNAEQEKPVEPPADPNAGTGKDPGQSHPDSPGAPAAGKPGGVAEVARAGADAARQRARAVMDNPPGYQPGAGNPLRQYRTQLLECFRTKVPKKRPYGSIVVDLVKYQGAHAVVAVASDTGNDTLEQCVQGAIGAASGAVAKASGPVERCPLAFGSIPLDAAEGIDITEDRIVAGRRMRVMVVDIVAEKSARQPAPGLDELYNWAEKLANKRLRQNHKTLANDQPVVIRPLGATPTRVVRRVMETTAVAGLDTVLTVAKADTWQPVNGFSLPGVPVPRGSGQGFSVDRHAGKHRDTGAPRVYASLLVGTDDVWLGVSRIDDFRHFTSRGQKLDLEVFQRGLRDVKQMKYFADRRDIEIAAFDEVPYDTLVTFIDYAIAAGFTEWTLMAPDQLSARPTDAP